MSSQVTTPDMDARLRVMRVIWAAFLGSTVLYAVVGYALNPPTFSWRSLGYAGEGGSVGLSLAAAGLHLLGLLAVVLFGPLALRSFNRRAEAEQNPALVQTGFIVALAVTEAGALIGLTLLFLTGSWNAFFLMGLSALMIALMRPRREQLEAAAYRKDSAR